jgi:2',3'-cyclic-nucleotide 2'-phosphodiesterase (5'-nucleotidase family)
MSSRFRSVVFAVAIASAMLAAQTTSPQLVAVHVFAINDFHGALEPPTGANSRIGDVAAGGAIYLATHLKQDTEANPPSSIIVAAGDLIGASPLCPRSCTTSRQSRR